MRAMAQWDILDEPSLRNFAANAATRQLVRGKEATLGSFVDHQVNTVLLTVLPFKLSHTCVPVYTRTFVCT